MVGFLTKVYPSAFINLLKGHGNENVKFGNFTFLEYVNTPGGGGVATITPRSKFASGFGPPLKHFFLILNFKEHRDASLKR